MRKGKPSQSHVLSMLCWRQISGLFPSIHTWILLDWLHLMTFKVIEGNDIQLEQYQQEEGQLSSQAIDGEKFYDKCKEKVLRKFFCF